MKGFVFIAVGIASTLGGIAAAHTFAAAARTEASSTAPISVRMSNTVRGKLITTDPAGHTLLISAPSLYEESVLQHYRVAFNERTSVTELGNNTNTPLKGLGQFKTGMDIAVKIEVKNDGTLYATNIIYTP